jgi:uncharacterized protein
VRVLITGATGLLGRQIARCFERPVVLARDPAAARAKLGEVESHPWHADKGPPPKEAFEGVQTVFHLVGESIDARWTARKKRRLWESRVLGTRHLVETLGALGARPRVLVSTSGVSYYGDRGDEELREDAGPGRGFLAELAVEWEREAQAAHALGLRVVCVRMGVVLADEGGALPQMRWPFRLGLGGRMGGGRQWLSWVHLDDAVGLLLHAAHHHEIEGAMNAASPQPVRNAEFTRALARALRRPAFLVVPRLAVRALFGERADLLFGSQRILPHVALHTGYTFRYPALGPALEVLLASAPAKRVT